MGGTYHGQACHPGAALAAAKGYDKFFVSFVSFVVNFTAR